MDEFEQYNQESDGLLGLLHDLEMEIASCTFWLRRATMTDRQFATWLNGMARKEYLYGDG